MRVAFRRVHPLSTVEPKLRHLPQLHIASVHLTPIANVALLTHIAHRATDPMRPEAP